MISCKEEKVNDESLVLRPSDLGCNKYVLSVDIKDDEFAILNYKYPSIIPPGIAANHISYNRWIKLKSSKSGKVTFSMTLMNSSYFRIISRSIQRDSNLPVHGLNIDGEEIVIITNSNIAAVNSDDNKFNITWNELNSDLSIKHTYNVECEVTVIKKSEALNIYPIAAKGYNPKSSQWSALQKIE